MEVSGLKERGLSGVQFVSDNHPGIKAALRDHYSGIPWQRCQYHFRQNAMDQVPKRRGDQILEALESMWRKENSYRQAKAKLSDGSAALLVAGDSAINEFDLQPKAHIVASAVVGVKPRIMGMGPVEATKKVMQRTDLTLDDMDIIELNETFAAQSLAVLRELGIDDGDERVNPNGGAIALGHPLGMTGARLLQTAMVELHERENAKYALCTLCVGVGQGMSVILEKT